MADTPSDTAPKTARTARHDDDSTDGVRTKWKVDGLKSSYVNFANANSTREEVVLNFGVNAAWDRSQAEVEIELSHRIVMSPFAARRLADLMNKLVAQYESRYGKMK